MEETTCILHGEKKTTDSIGQCITEKTDRKVFCKKQSAGAKEFHEAALTGLIPQYVIRVFFGDYEGERYATLDGRPYHVYRTYRKGDTMELYLEEAVSDEA